MPIENITLWCKQRGLSEEAIKEVELIRSSEPSRRVKSKVNNVSGFYPSKKMGLTIQFESRTVELAAIYEKEHNGKVIEYYDQPPSFPIKYQVNGRNCGHYYTPDFFVISEDWIGWEEWKTEEDLIKLSEKYPTRYCLDEKGQWISPPVQAYAEKKGISFKIRLSKEINWSYQRNIRFLEDYLLNEKLMFSPTITLKLKEYVELNPGVTLQILLSNENFNADDVYTLIALGELYVDLYDIPIPQYDLVKVFINKSTARAFGNVLNSQENCKYQPNLIKIEIGNKVQWDGRPWTIINIGETKISLIDDNSAVIDIPNSSFNEFATMGKIQGVQNKSNETNNNALEILRTACEKELKEANKRYSFICEILNGASLDTIPVPNRTLRNWLKNYRVAERKYNNGFIGLISKKHKRGNRVRKLNTTTIELMNEYIQNEYLNTIQKSKTTVYNLFVEASKEKGYRYPCFKTFCKEIDKRQEYEKVKSRKGRKAAYNKEPFYWYLEQTTPRHGDRPFEIAHIDHTQLDIELVCSKTGKNLGRPWATFMIDAYSRRILAGYVTYDDPSYRSNLMVIRECVKRHGKLPKVLVVDGGKDFQSTYFETLLACYKIQKQVRPGSKPRFGSVCERYFGTTNTSFIHNLIGNTQLMANVRQVPKELSAKNHAIWTLPLFAEYLFKWLYEIYDNMDHSVLGESPREAYLSAIAKTGERKFMIIPYDGLFQMLTFPTTNKGTAKVQPGRGIKINRFYYWSNLLYDPNIEGKQVEVRYDPFNMGVAYAYIKKRWVQLHSEYQIQLTNRTEKEIQIAFEELRQRKRIQGRNSSITAKQLVNFLCSAHDVERLQLQKLKDNEVKEALYVLEGGKSKEPKIEVTNSTLSKKQIVNLPKNKENTNKPRKRIIYEEF
jgi:putative transposase